MWYVDDDFGFGKGCVVEYFFDEMFDYFFGVVEIGDDVFVYWVDGFDVVGCVV